MRLFYITAHVLLRPSLYAFHNILSVISGFSQLAEDIAVLEDIYGDGVLNRNLWWPIICIAIPIVVSFVELIKSFCGWLAARGKEDKEDFSEVVLLIEGSSLPRFFVLAAFLSGCGIVFTQLVVCAESDTPPMGVQVITSLLVTDLIIGGVGLFLYALRETLNLPEEVEDPSESFDILDDIKTQWGCCGPPPVSNTK
jgi:hypothetical protein